MLRRVQKMRRAIAPEMVGARRFDGAAGGRRGGGMGSFHAINQEVAASGSTLRSRARYLANNNSFIANGLANWTASLVGPGIMPISRHPEPVIRKLIGAVFGQWADEADADGRTDFWGLQADVARGLILDGETFVHAPPSKNGPRLRLLPPEQIDESLTRDLGDGGAIVQGVEFAADGQRTAYHILPTRPTAQFGNFAPPIRIPTDEICHIFKPLAAGQVRGVSWLAPVILPASELDQLVDGLLIGVRVAALHAAFLVDANSSGTIPYDGTQSGSILETGLEPGTLKVLPSGYDIRFNSPQQASETAAFVRFNLQSLAAGLGLPEHLLSGDLTGANYSSLRAGLLPFRQRVEQIQYGTLVPQFLRPVWQRVVTVAILSGELSAVDFEENARDYLSADFLPPRPMQVDPQKDVSATIAEIEAGLTSRRRAVAERGWDMAELDSEIASDTFRKRQNKEPSE